MRDFVRTRTKREPSSFQTTRSVAEEAPEGLAVPLTKQWDAPGHDTHVGMTELSPGGPGRATPDH